MVPEGGGPLPAGAEGAGEGGLPPPEAAAQAPMALLEQSLLTLLFCCLLLISLFFLSCGLTGPCPGTPAAVSLLAPAPLLLCITPPFQGQGDPREQRPAGRAGLASQHESGQALWIRLLRCPSSEVGMRSHRDVHGEGAPASGLRVGTVRGIDSGSKRSVGIPAGAFLPPYPGLRAEELLTSVLSPASTRVQLPEAIGQAHVMSPHPT